MSSRWQECDNCGEEYQVIGGSLDQIVQYCCFCGEPIETDEDLEDEEEDE